MFCHRTSLSGQGDVRAYGCSDIGKGNYRKIVLNLDLQSQLCFCPCHCPELFFIASTPNPFPDLSRFYHRPIPFSKVSFSYFIEIKPILRRITLIPLKSYCSLMVPLFSGLRRGRHSSSLPRLALLAVLFLPNTVLSESGSTYFALFPVALFPTCLQAF